MDDRDLIQTTRSAKEKAADLDSLTRMRTYVAENSEPDSGVTICNEDGSLREVGRPVQLALLLQEVHTFLENRKKQFGQAFREPQHAIHFLGTLRLHRVLEPGQDSQMATPRVVLEELHSLLTGHCIHHLLRDYTIMNTKVEEVLVPPSDFVPEPLEMFEKFVELPVELRLVIWELALREHTRTFVIFANLDHPRQTQLENFLQRSITALSTTNHEARRTVTNQRGHGFRPLRAFEYDTLNITASTNQYNPQAFNRALASIDLRDSFGVKHLILHMKPLLIALLSQGMIPNLRDHLPNLRTVKFIVHLGNDCQWPAVDPSSMSDAAVHDYQQELQDSTLALQSMVKLAGELSHFRRSFEWLVTKFKEHPENRHLEFFGPYRQVVQGAYCCSLSESLQNGSLRAGTKLCSYFLPRILNVKVANVAIEQEAANGANAADQEDVANGQEDAAGDQ